MQGKLTIRKDDIVYTVTHNCYHICVTRRLINAPQDNHGAIVFKRENAPDENWLDAEHQQIVNALNALENALERICK